MFINTFIHLSLTLAISNLHILVLFYVFYINRFIVCSTWGLLEELKK